MKMIFYYDVAPNTARSFLTLASEGYFNGQIFHRVVPDFVIQGGDPRGDGTGGPGYTVNAEFNDRPHEAGALSMARSGDPNEAPGLLPRAEYANSAGSQFFICLNYKNTQQLDRRYTVFGKVVDGMDTVNSIGQLPIADPRTGRPKDPVSIVSAEVKRVDKDHNPYRPMLLPGEPASPATQPTTQP
jgi:peptidyl-prolyl cis-trans isomerase B (cyclophilin B)